MAPPPNPPPAARGGGSGFSKKLGPLPAWAWAAVALGLVVAYYLYRRSAAASAPTDTSGQSPDQSADTTSTGGSTSGYSDQTLAALIDQNQQLLNQLLSRVIGGGSPAPAPGSSPTPPGPGGGATTTQPPTVQAQPSNTFAVPPSYGFATPGPGFGGPVIDTGFGAATTPSVQPVPTYTGHGPVID